MGRRLFNGNAFSENGWPYVDQDGCTWIIVPGTNPPVRLQIQNGPPLIILPALVADLNAYVEHTRDPDSASWTPGNSVRTSNHPGGTAVDVDWNTHKDGTGPAFINRGFTAAQVEEIRRILSFYEGMIFWGNDWPTYHDPMHWQMGSNSSGDFDTYHSDNRTGWDGGVEPKVFDFIKRKIRPDGFSTYRRSNTPPPPVLSRADRYALTIITEGQKLGVTPRGNKIAISVGLVETNLQNYANSNDPESVAKNPDGSDKYPHDNVGNDHMSSGVFQQQPPWGPLECRMDVACAARLFFTCDNGGGVRGLLKIRDNLGRIYDYNDESHTPGFFAQKVQGSAFPDRYDKRYAEAEQIYNRLLLLPPPSEEGFLMGLSDAEQHEVLNGIRAWMAAQKSRSPLHDPGEGEVGNAVDQVWDIDGNVHLLAMFLVAFLGVPSQIELLERVAANGDTEEERMIAQAILAETADMHDVKEGILAALGRITTAAPSTAVVRVAEPEVLPAARPTVSQMGPFAPAPEPSGNTPQDLLDTLDKLKVFDGSYRDKFDELTKGDKK